MMRETDMMNLCWRADNRWIFHDRFQIGKARQGPRAPARQTLLRSCCGFRSEPV